jgi:hypothetical protein
MSENQQGLAGLFKKISIIQGELGAVPKDAQHQQRYMYHSADAVMGALNPLLTKYSLVIIPSTIPSSDNARVIEGADGLTRWLIDYEFTIADGETGAFFVAHWTSEGVMSVGKADDGTPKADDKSMGKAHTYALKYWLIQLFKISTKDTVDLDQNNQDGDERSAKPATPHVLDKPDNVSDGGLDKYTAMITKVDVKLNRNNKPYIVAGGVIFNNRDAFRALKFDAPVIDRLEKVGAVTLPDGIVITYIVNENGYKEPTAVKRVKTGDVYEVVAA